MNSYLKMIGLSKQVDFECDPSCLTLLNEIGLAEALGSCLTVTHAMSLDWIASPATLHRRLDMLRDAGYIDHVYKPGNYRTKLIITMPKAIQFFKELEKCLLSATQK